MVYLKIVYNGHYSHINRLLLNQPSIHLLYKKYPWCERVHLTPFVCETRTEAEEAVDHHTILRQCPLCGTSWG